MKDNPKDNTITNSDYDSTAIGYKPDQQNSKKPLKPATSANDNGSKPEKEISDNNHEHSYTPPTDGKPVVSEETQNSNPGNVQNSDQGANQLN